MIYSIAVMNTQEDDRTACTLRYVDALQSSIPLSVEQMESVITSSMNKIDSYSEIIRIDRKNSVFIKKQIQPNQNRFREPNEEKSAGSLEHRTIPAMHLQLHLSLRMRSKSVRPPSWLMAFMRSPP